MNAPLHANRDSRPGNLGLGSAHLFDATGGFSLIEVMLVMAIVVVVAALAGVALKGIGKAGDITKVTYDLAGVIQNARAYAITNNTYVWVGFFEESAGKASSGVSGTGRVILSTVASKDGSSLATSGSAVGNSYRLTPDQLIQVSKLVKIENAHLATFTAGSGLGSTFDARPKVTSSDAQFGDTTPSNSVAQFQYPTVGSSPQYLFSKTMRFSPRGEIHISTLLSGTLQYSLTPVVEIGLRPSQGSQVEMANPNVAAIQISGVLGSIKIYRR